MTGFITNFQSPPLPIACRHLAEPIISRVLLHSPKQLASLKRQLVNLAFGRLDAMCMNLAAQQPWCLVWVQG